jgi:hypothetical protein
MLSRNLYAAFNWMSAGTTPFFRYRHNIIANFRATATMAMRFPRLFFALFAVR